MMKMLFPKTKKPPKKELHKETKSLPVCRLWFKKEKEPCLSEKGLKKFSKNMA